MMDVIDDDHSMAQLTDEPFAFDQSMVHMNHEFDTF